MEVVEITKGLQFKNWKDEIHEIINVSPTGLIITALNIETNEVLRFRFYNASGEYIKEGTANTTLGYLLK